MAIDITLNDQFLWVSNMRFLTLLDFANDVGPAVRCEPRRPDRLRSRGPFSNHQREEVVGSGLQPRRASHLPSPTRQSGGPGLAAFCHRRRVCRRAHANSRCSRG
jgi:hypothetical protein